MARLAIAALSVLLLASAAHAQGAIRDGGFVATDGTRFVTAGRPFHVVGANAAVTHGADQRARMEAVLDAVAADGLNVIRVWALGEAPADAPPWADDYYYRRGPDGWIEAGFEQLDRVLAAARERDLRVVLVLANRWGDYGGAPQYLRWAGLEDPGRHPSPLAMTAFWECGDCERWYQDHVRRVVGRVNHVTGVPYAEDPTIFAWELMNEAAAAGARGERSMLDWMDRQARLVRELDPNHLVSAGHIGYRLLGARRTWARACALPSIDYCDSHAYPLRSGRVRSPAQLARWIDDRVQLAHHVAQKPLLFGEVGVRTDRLGRFGRERAPWLDAMIRRILADGAAGAMIWTYLPSSGERRRYGVYADGRRASQTRDVRGVLRRWARHSRDRAPRCVNPAVRADRGDALLFDPVRSERGPGVVHRGSVDEATGERAILIDPGAFEQARFEHAGAHDGDPGLPHFYGSGEGEVTYLFTRPRGAARRASIRVRMRASSELPGHGGPVVAEDGSQIEVSIDGVSIGTVELPPDDGRGRWVEVARDDVELPRRAVHRLRLRASAAGGGGVCVYGATPAGEASSIELRWSAAAEDAAPQTP